MFRFHSCPIIVHSLLYTYVLYSHQSCYVARPRNCCRTRWNFYTPMYLGAKHEILNTIPVMGGHVWFWCTSHLGVKECSHLSHRVTVPRKCGGSRWNLVAISNTSSDIRYCICTSGLWRPCLIYQSPRHQRVVIVVSLCCWTPKMWM